MLLLTHTDPDAAAQQFAACLAALPARVGCVLGMARAAEQVRWLCPALLASTQASPELLHTNNTAGAQQSFLHVDKQLHCRPQRASLARGLLGEPLLARSPS